MHYFINFPADYKNVPPLRDLGYRMVALQGFSPEEANHVKSIVDELLSNAIEYGSQSGSLVELELFSDEKQVKIVCSDRGLGNKMTANQIEEKLKIEVPVTAARGRGINMIVKSYATSLDFRDREGGGIIVTAVLAKSS